ncbi:glucokinase [Nitrosomonas oligotropha]|uniref:glucokinase n=1 Tax=Nitrosomonas oligotropha TaxID=42354 RepID=UPI0030844127
MNKQLIYGDIGGTKTILQMAEITADGQIHERCTQRYDSTAFATFSSMLEAFFKQTAAANPPAAACFAMAGPIAGQQATLTNLPWQIGSADIAHAFSIPSVKLINDFEAVALAVENLPGSDLITLQTGKPHAQAMRVVLGAGTGMGVAWLTPVNNRYLAWPTEAGHIDFAPVTALQIALLESLQQRFGHVSVERLLSGAGLTNIFKFLQQNAAASSDLPPIPLEEDSGGTIAALAQTQKHPVAIQALELFAEIYGAYAGNLALAGLCRGGVYIAGGIAPKIIDILSGGGFMYAFHAKGRFSALLHEIPVHVVTNPAIGLLGARQEARRLLDNGP